MAGVVFPTGISHATLNVPDVTTTPVPPSPLPIPYPNIAHFENPPAVPVVQALFDPPDIDQFINDGVLRASSRAILGSVGIALVVREGAPKPDISTPEKLRKVLLDARKIVHSRPGDTPSGKFLIEIFQDLGVTEEMKPKVVYHNVVDGGT